MRWQITKPTDIMEQVMVLQAVRMETIMQTLEFVLIKISKTASHDLSTGMKGRLD